jgi:hypothetical protein
LGTELDLDHYIMDMEQTLTRLLAARRAGHEKMMVKLDDHHEGMRASENVWRKATTADLEAMETYPEKMEANPEEMKSVKAHEEIPTGWTAVQTFQALKKQHRDRHLTVGRRRQQLKKRAQGNGGSRKKFAAISRGMTRRAGVAWRKL